MTYGTIPLLVFIILLIVAFLFLILLGFEIFICCQSLKIEKEYEENNVKKYGTQDDSEN